MCGLPVQEGRDARRLHKSSDSLSGSSSACRCSMTGVSSCTSSRSHSSSAAMYFTIFACMACQQASRQGRSQVLPD